MDAAEPFSDHLEPEIGSFTHDLDADLIEGSEQLRVIFGLDATGPVTTARFIESIHPEDRARVGATLARAFAGTDHELQVEYRLLRPEGTVKWIVAVGQIRRDSSGRPATVFGIVRDVTQRRVTAERLRRLNRTYAVLSEVNSLILRRHRPEEIGADACRIAVEFGGFRAAWLGLLGESDARLRPLACAGEREVCAVLDDLSRSDRCECPYMARAVGTRTHAVCNAISRAPENLVWRAAAERAGIQAMTSLALVAFGRVAGVFNLYAAEPGFFDAEEMRLLDTLAANIGFALEVSERDRERKLAQAELSRREEHFRLLIEYATDLITVLDHAGVIRFQSPAVEAVTGYRPDEVCGRRVVELVHPEDLPRVNSALAQVIARPGEPIRVEYRLKNKSGEWVVLQTSGRSIPGQSEEGFVVLNSRDVTESRRLEEQLRHSQKMEAVGLLAGGVAHDFNNLLSVIRLQTDLTEMQTPSPEIREGLQQIRAAAERAGDLTRQLLLFSRRQVMQQRDIDLNETVTSLAKMLQRVIGEHVNLELRLHGAPLITRADRGMLDQVLLNLAINARDAMPRGGRLAIETGARTIAPTEAADLDVRPGRYVSLAISDTGTGIAPEILPRIFEPFFTTKEAGKGTGLGLATAFGIVKQHLGALQVESSVGHGTRFTILLPAIEGRVADNGVDSPASKPKGGSETLLVVEDDVAVRLVTRAILEHYGYRVLEAADGVEALATWQRESASIALLLTDLVMPAGVTGHELASRLRSDRPELRVIYSSGYSADVAGRNLELRPGENFLQKPFPPDVLLRAVRRTLDDPTPGAG